jgi:hypothetical protein
MFTGNILLQEDQKIDIAVDVEIANCERTLQIRADENYRPAHCGPA